jgi:monofunctional biosynthetic peptidoglycan transglycosylase
VKKFFKILWKFAWIMAVAFLASSLFFVLLYKFVNPPITPLMVIRLSDQAVNGEQMILKKKWMPLKNISPNLRLAVIASEDNRFVEHHGFDYQAIEKARDYNEKMKGKRLHGASTISQQTAKNVFLWPGRFWIRKGLEAYFTVLIELVWGKRRILEVYLNVIELGKGIYGAEAASEIYFGRHAADLRPGEAALLAAILPDPLKWNPAHPTKYLQDRQLWILWNMGNMERFGLLN